MRKFIITLGIILFILPFLSVPIIGISQSEEIVEFMDDYFFIIPILSFTGMGLIIFGNFIGYKKQKETNEQIIKNNISNQIDYELTEHICKYCGNIIDSDSTFCKYCGKKQ